MRGKSSILILLVCMVFLLSYCSDSGDSQPSDADDGNESEDSAETLDAFDYEAAETHDLQELQDIQDGSDMPYRWINPRCDDYLVSSCDDCPGRPFVCHPCELEARCVADCDADCSGRTNCADNGTCTDSEAECITVIFCGCPPPQKECKHSGTVSCVDNCTTQCPDRQQNFYGLCRDMPEGMGGCTDNEGPEYFCSGANPDGTGVCVSSCESCGPTYCLSKSCHSQHCERGYDPDSSFFVCAEKWCCTDGFFCTATSECVTACSECGAEYIGACGPNGVCVTDCGNCNLEGEGRIEVCEGVCVDIHSDLPNCGGCGQVCSGIAVACSSGHCCEGALSDPPPWQWCEQCNCCLTAGYTCVPEACVYGCVSTVHW